MCSTNSWVVSKLDYWLELHVKWKPFERQFFLPSFMGGNVRLVVPWNTTCKCTINPTSVICLLSSIPKICMCLAPFLSHVQSLLVGTKWTLIWSILTTTHGGICTFWQGKQLDVPWMSLLAPMLIVVSLLLLWMFRKTNSNDSSWNLLSILKRL
jgi:hypothetical protein